MSTGRALREFMGEDPSEPELHIDSTLQTHIVKRREKKVDQEFLRRWKKCDPNSFKQKNTQSTCDGFFNDFPNRLHSWGEGEIVEKYELVKRVGGGKSGAIVLEVKDIKTQAPCLLKIYTSTFDEWGDVKDERGLREINTQCKLSRHMGFNNLRCFGILEKIPEGWIYKKGTQKLELKSSYLRTSVEIISNDTDKKKIEYNMMLNEALYGEVLFMVTDWTPANLKPLFNIDLVGLDKSYLRGLFGEIWSTQETMSAVIGEDFTHWDMHPDNIFVETLKGNRGTAERNRALGKMNTFSVPNNMLMEFLNNIAGEYLPNQPNGQEQIMPVIPMMHGQNAQQVNRVSRLIQRAFEHIPAFEDIRTQMQVFSRIFNQARTSTNRLIETNNAQIDEFFQAIRARMSGIDMVSAEFH